MKLLDVYKKIFSESFMANFQDWQARQKIAQNTHIDPEIVSMFWTDDDWRVRRAVAINHKAFPQVQAQLAKDTNWEVRRAVAGQIHTLPEVLKELAQDEKLEVREAAIQNPTYIKHFGNQQGQKV